MEAKVDGGPFPPAPTAMDGTLGESAAVSPSEPRPFPKLPFELTAHVLGFLKDVPYSLHACICVSRVWAIAGTPVLWSTPSLATSRSARCVLGVLSRGVPKDSIHSRSGPDLSFPYHQYVHTLDLRWGGLLAVVGSATGLLESALQACGRNLRSLLLGINSGWVLRGISLPTLCPGVNFVDLSNFDIGPHEVNETISANARGLTLMDVDINKHFAVDFFRRFDSLEEIGYSDAWGSRLFEPKFTDEEVDTIARSMSGAKVLRLRLGGSVTRLREDSALMLHAVARMANNVRELYLEDTLTTNDIILLTFLRNNPRLRALSVSSGLLTRASLDGIGKLAQNLVRLRISLRTPWTAGQLAHILPQLPKLRHLHLNASTSPPQPTRDPDLLAAALISTRCRLSTLELFEPTPMWREMWQPVLARHGPTLDALTMNPSIALSIDDLASIVSLCPMLGRLVLVSKSVEGGAGTLANPELTRTDLNGFAFVYGGRELHRVRDLSAVKS
ncbi:hypothetical protein DFJ74DRAFT_655313 [Hyaloraphidium curvatum]|nr:hypothetical protein DFJ74DRAFT_655313 [Hyaloraphidium curvatum]